MQYYINIFKDEKGKTVISDGGEAFTTYEAARNDAAKYVMFYEWTYIATLTVNDNITASIARDIDYYESLAADHEQLNLDLSVPHTIEAQIEDAEYCRELDWDFRNSRI